MSNKAHAFLNQDTCQSGNKRKFPKEDNLDLPLPKKARATQNQHPGTTPLTTPSMASLGTVRDRHMSPTQPSDNGIGPLTSGEDTGIVESDAMDVIKVVDNEPVAQAKETLEEQLSAS